LAADAETDAKTDTETAPATAASSPKEIGRQSLPGAGGSKAAEVNNNSEYVLFFSCVG
jgi:hypothetical protein